MRTLTKAIQVIKASFTGMTYREYAKLDGHTDAEIENSVDGLFGADQKLGAIIEETPSHIAYDMGNGYVLYSNNSSYDVVEQLDNEGNVLEEWQLEYN